MKSMINKPYVMIKSLFKKMEKENRVKRQKLSHKSKGDR